MNQTKKKKKTLKWIIGITTFLLIIAIILPEPQTDTNQGEPKKMNKEKTYNINQPIQLDELQYKILKAETFTQMGNQLFNKKTTGKFVKIQMQILNTGSETHNLLSPRFKIKDEQNRLFDRFPGDYTYIADPLEFGIQLQPGVLVMGSIVFEVPESVDDLVLVIDGDWLSMSEVEVSLGELKDVGVDDSLERLQEELLITSF